MPLIILFLLLSTVAVVGVAWVALIWRPEDLGPPLHYRIHIVTLVSVLVVLANHLGSDALRELVEQTVLSTIAWWIVLLENGIAVLLLIVLERRAAGRYEGDASDSRKNGCE